MLTYFFMIVNERAYKEPSKPKISVLSDCSLSRYD